ncbi:MAG: polymer-forming cytoskeletal protein [Candidatus Nanohalobium sp.]
MKRYKLAAATAFLLLMVSGTAAQNFRTGGNIVIGNETGPITAAAGSVTVQGPVKGDLTIYSGSATVNGPVNGNLKIYSGNVQVQDQVRGKLSVASGNFIMDKGAVVDGNADISSGKIQINGRINGNTSVTGQELTLGDSAVITGNLNYDTETFENRGQVQGATKQFHRQTRQTFTALSTFLTVVGFVSKLIVGAVIIAILPGYTSRVSETVREEPGLTFIKGLIALIAIPVIAIIAAITIVGIPVAVLTLLAYATILWIATILGPYGIGQEIIGEGSKWISLILGLAIFEILGLIPVIGWILQALIAITGLGAMLMPGVRKFRERRSP